MDGHRRRPRLLHSPGKLHAVDGALVPAQAELHRHRAPGPPDHRLHHLHRQLRGAHQAGAVPGVGHLGHRTAHVDVDDVGPGHLAGDGRALLHACGVAAENLGGAGVLLFPHLEQGNGLFILIAQSFGADHLGAGQPRPLLPADGPKSQVSHPGHGPQSQGRFDFNSSDGQHGLLRTVKYRPYRQTCILPYPEPVDKGAASL